MMIMFIFFNSPYHILFCRFYSIISFMDEDNGSLKMPDLRDKEGANNDSAMSKRCKKRWRLFMDLFIIFFVFSLFGHYIEVIWAITKHLAFGSNWYPKISDMLPLAAPYGLGAVALVLLVWPAFGKHKKHPFTVLAMCSIITGAVEFLCAALLVLLYGKNYYWDYSKMPLNLFGYIHLSGCLAFGAISLIFLYFIYPNWKKIYDRLSDKTVSLVFWLLFILYVINMFLVCTREFWK